jgi:hypothetical protein
VAITAFRRKFIVLCDHKFITPRQRKSNLPHTHKFILVRSFKSFMLHERKLLWMAIIFYAYIAKS